MTMNRVSEVGIKNYFRCNVRTCGKRVTFFYGLIINFSKLSVEKMFSVIYNFVENCSEKNVLRNNKISKNCYNKIKQVIRKFIMKQNKEKSVQKLGNNGNAVQIDETAICSGLLNDCPSQLKDDCAGVTWLVGVIEEKT